MDQADLTPTPEPTTPLKPMLRGWLHLGMAPVIFIAGLVFTALAPTIEGRIGCAVYTLTAVQLFGTSAAYHRGNWSDRGLAIFRRIDHSNIFVFIAGTYTPLTLTLLDGASRWSLLIMIWSVAILGVIFRTTWLSAPRWLYTLLYVAMGWTIVVAFKPTVELVPQAALILMALGGLAYTVGVFFYIYDRIPYNHAIWHGFVMAGTAFHFFGVLFYVVLLPSV